MIFPESYGAHILMTNNNFYVSQVSSSEVQKERSNEQGEKGDKETIIGKEVLPYKGEF